MAVTPSGAISMADLNTALGRSSSAAISIDDFQVRFIANQMSGSVNMNALRNKTTFNGTVTTALIESKKDFSLGYIRNQQGSITGTLFGAPVDIWCVINSYSYIQTVGNVVPTNTTARAATGTLISGPYSSGTGTGYVNGFGRISQFITGFDYVGLTLPWQLVVD